MGRFVPNFEWQHHDLSKVSLEDFTADIAANEKILTTLAGNTNWKFFRYPFLREGATAEKRNGVRSYLTKNKYQTAQVTIDFEDWSWNSPYARCENKRDQKAIAWLKSTYLQNADDQLARAEILSKFLFKREIAHILLLDIGALDAKTLDALLTRYEKAGVKFISLTEAAREPIYTIDPAVLAKRGGELIIKF